MYPEKTIEERTARLEAATACSNLMGRFSSYFLAEQYNEMIENLFALNDPFVRIETMWGVYEGADSLRRFADYMASKVKPGVMHCCSLNTPYIEVAEDLQSVRGAWVSNGHETEDFDNNGGLRAHWVWYTFGADFILENGAWKMLHLHFYGHARGTFEDGWAKEDNWDITPKNPEDERYRADRPCSDNWMHSPWRSTRLLPVLPKPYRTLSWCGGSEY